MSSNFVFSFVLVTIAAVIRSGQGAVIPKNYFTFLGKFTNPTITADQLIQESYYFLSQNAAGWSTAASDCKANLGDTATLVYIETDEEQAEVTRFLQSSDDTGSTYWTGGKYDPAQAAFVWDNGVELLASAAWAAGHPNTRTPVTRVLISRAGSVSLRTDFQTVSLRYICELTV